MDTLLTVAANSKQAKELIFLQRVIYALCILFLSACTSNSCREWTMDCNITPKPEFNSGRLNLSPHHASSSLALELYRNASGIWLYLNVLSLKIPPSETDEQVIDIEIIFADEEQAETFTVFLLDGEQRLLFPTETTQKIIEKLLDEENFTIRVGKASLEVISTKFNELYGELLKIVVAQVSKEI